MMTAHYRGLSQLLCGEGLMPPGQVTGTFIYLFISSFTPSFIHVFIHSFIHSLVRSFIHLLLLPDPILTPWSQDRRRLIPCLG